MSFKLEIGMLLVVDKGKYQIAEHPAAPGMPYGQEGRAAVVYQVLDEAGSPWALKVFKEQYRVPSLVRVTERISPYATLPGLRVCRRTVISATRHRSLLRQYPDLNYAVLMPWIDGPTWFQTLWEKQALSPSQSLALATSLAEILTGLEEQGVAHCDLSAANILLPYLTDSFEELRQSPVELVDVEQLYGPDLSCPDLLVSGSPGYAFPSEEDPQWDRESDRFAGAILIAEMLGWCDERVRNAAWGESYFDPGELQKAGARYELLRSVLAERWGQPIARLFYRTWHAETISFCPTFGEWLAVLPIFAPDINVLIAVFVDGVLQTYRQLFILAPQTSSIADELQSMVVDFATKKSAQVFTPDSLSISPAPKQEISLQEAEQKVEITHKEVPTLIEAENGSSLEKSLEEKIITERPNINDIDPNTNLAQKEITSEVSSDRPVKQEVGKASAEDSTAELMSAKRKLQREGQISFAFVIVLILTLITFILLSVRQPSPSASAVPASPIPTSPDTTEKLRIAVLVPISGDLKSFGESAVNGVKLAVDKWNSQGGVLGKTIEVIIEDTQCNAEVAVRAARKVINQEGVEFIIGDVCSSTSIPISLHAVTNDVLQITPTSTNLSITVDSNGNTKPTVFRACFIDSFQGRAAAEFALNDLGAQTAAVFMDSTNYVRDLAEVFIEAFEAGGGQILVNETYSGLDQDFSALLTNVKAVNPDLLYLPDYYSKVNLIAAQAKKMGISTVMMGSDGWDSTDLDYAAVEGGYYTNHYSVDDQNPRNQEFVQAYIKSTATMPDALAALAYDSAEIIFQAIEKSATDDPIVVSQAMENMEFDLVSGRLVFDLQHNPNKSVAIMKIQDETLQYYTTVERSEYTLTESESLAFFSDRSGTLSIYVMNSDGSQVHRLTDEDTSAVSAATSQNGTGIAFLTLSNEIPEICIANFLQDGGIECLNLDVAVGHGFFSLSPDAKWVAFSSNAAGDPDIYITNIEDGSIKQLTTEISEEIMPVWSSDGKQIVFTSDRDGNMEIYTMKIDGSDVNRITDNLSEDYGVAWSPDGKQIAFASDRDGNVEIYKMYTDGSNIVRLTNNSAFDMPTAWSPDGKQIAFTSDRDGNSEIYVMNSDGSAVKRLTNNPADDAWAVWVKNVPVNNSFVMTESLDRPELVFQKDGYYPSGGAVEWNIYPFTAVPGTYTVLISTNDNDSQCSLNWQVRPALEPDGQAKWGGASNTSADFTLDEAGDYIMYAARVWPGNPYKCQAFTYTITLTLSSLDLEPTKSSEVLLSTSDDIISMDAGKLYKEISAQNASQLTVISRTFLDGVITQAEFFPSNDTLAVASTEDFNDHLLFYPRQLNHREQFVPQEFSSGWAQYFALSPHDDTVALGLSSKLIWLGRVSDSSYLHTLMGHTQDILALSFSTDGRFLGSASRDNTVRIWRVSDGLELNVLNHTWAKYGYGVQDIVFSPNDKYIFTYSNYDGGGVISFWQTADGTLLWNHDISNLQHSAISPAFDSLATCSQDGYELWRISPDGLSKAISFQAPGRVDCLKSVFSPDGLLWVLGSFGGDIWIWDTSTGALVASLDPHGDAIRDVSFSANGSLLATASQDGEIRVWAISTE